MNSKNKKLIFSLLWVYSIIFAVQAIADEIKLIGGDIIRGEIIEEIDSAVTLDHKDLGMLKISKDKIQSITKETPKSVEPKIITEQDALKEKDASKKQEPNKHKFNLLDSFAAKAKKKGYSFSINLSVDTSTGNTEEQSYRFGLDITRKIKNLDFRSDLTYYNKIKKGTTTDNKLSLGVERKKFYENSRWFTFMTARYDYDEFESWLHRLSGHLGPGYRLISKDTLLLDLKVGAGGKKEWRSDNNNPKFEGYAGTDLEWKPKKRHTFTLSSAVFPILSDFSEYRTRTTFNWGYLVSSEMDLSFIVGLLHEYQSVVDPGDEKDDLRIYSGIRFKF